MKAKQLTFVWQDMNGHTINTLQWSTMRRTITEAWDDATAYLMIRNSSTRDLDPALLLTFKGLAEVLSDDVPLRYATKEELKQLLKLS